MQKGAVIGLVLAVVIIAAIAGYIIYKPSVQKETAPAAEAPETTEEEIEIAETQTPASPITSPAEQTFLILADDKGFYINSQKTSSILAAKENIVKITFNVSAQNVYYGGLDFRGCGQNSGWTKPGSSTILQFTADSTCTITSYWPSSGVVKSKLQIIVS